jgi:rubrerythrin
MADQELKQTLLSMLQIELEAMQFYQQASRFLQDEGAIYHFDQLALEELEHARIFYDVYPEADLPEFAQLVRDLPHQAATLKAIDQHRIAHLTEQQALQLAIKLEKEAAGNLQHFLAQVQSPAAQAAIEKNIQSTLGHLELIEQDYQRLFS